MNGFMHCPQCGRLDAQRTCCACGYALKADAPDEARTDSAQPTNQFSGEPRNPVRNFILIMIGLTLCGVLAYFFGPKRSGMDDMRSEMERINQTRVSDWEKRNRDKISSFNSQMQALQKVTTEEEAELALSDALFDMRRANIDIEVARVGGEGDMYSKKASNAKELSEIWKALSAEIKRLGMKYPKAYLAATKKTPGMVPGIRP